MRKFISLISLLWSVHFLSKKNIDFKEAILFSRRTDVKARGFLAALVKKM